MNFGRITIKKCIFFIIIFIVVSESHSELIHPVDGEIYTSLSIAFEWDQISTVDEYNLQVATDTSFHDVLVNLFEETTVYVLDSILDWNQTYFWRLRTVNDSIFSTWIDTFQFTINNSQIAPTITTIYNENSLHDGYILFNGLNPIWGRGAVAIDKSGKHMWYTNTNIYLNHVNRYGEIFGIQSGLESLGAHINFYGDIIWSPSNINNSIDNHEFKQLPNGNYMGFDNVYRTGPIPLGSWTEDFQDLGYIADGLTDEFSYMGQVIYEWDQESGHVIWSWNSFDHFSLSEIDLIGDSWQKAILQNVFDFTHANAWDYSETDSALYVSFRQLSRISKISYPSGNVIWNMGLPEEYGFGSENICTELGFSYQHNIQVLDDGSLMFFDNGNLSDIVKGDEFPTSRVHRITIDEEFECQSVWQYELPQDMYGYAQGSVQLLENGNYLIYTTGGESNSLEATIIEVSEEKDILWKTSVDGGPGSYGWYYRAYFIKSINPDAFSVMFDNFNSTEIQNQNHDFISINSSNPTISYTIYNKSDIMQAFVYDFKDYDGWFNNKVDTIQINANASATINISSQLDLEINDSQYEINLNVWPLKHKYAMKTFNEIVYMFETPLKSYNSPIPSDFTLYQNYPNPFNHTTYMDYEIPKDGMVKISIHDAKGQLINTPVNNYQTAGFKSIVWDATNEKNELLQTGLYFYTIQSGKFSQTKKMLFLK